MSFVFIVRTVSFSNITQIQKIISKNIKVKKIPLDFPLEISQIAKEIFHGNYINRNSINSVIIVQLAYWLCSFHFCFFSLYYHGYPKTYNSY